MNSITNFVKAQAEQGYLIGLENLGYAVSDLPSEFSLPQLKKIALLFTPAIADILAYPLDYLNNNSEFNIDQYSYSASAGLLAASFITPIASGFIFILALMFISRILAPELAAEALYLEPKLDNRIKKEPVANIESP